MPNWCDNDLIVSIGRSPTKEEKTTRIYSLKRFKEFAKRHTTDAINTNQFVPYPKEFATKDKAYHKVMDEVDKLPQEERKKWFENNTPPKDGFNSGGYEWCQINWGSKWGICHSELVSEDYKRGIITYRFDSPWSPPAQVIVAMSKKFPDLEFTLKYFECGMAFKGMFKTKAGEVTYDKHGAYRGGRGG